MSFAKPYIMCSIFAVLQACEPSRPQLHSHGTARSALRADAIGCWELALAADTANDSDRAKAIMFVRLDSSVARSVGERGERDLQRLDSTGKTLTRDAEGFSFIDSWSADSASDRIRITFNNGLYGSRWVLTLPDSSGQAKTMRGESQEFGDVVPPPPEPIRPSVARRVPCAAAAIDSSPGS